MIKIAFVILLGLNGMMTQAQALNSCEGPYVGYHGDWVVVRSIDPAGLVQVDSFPMAEKGNHPLSVRFSNHSGWDFMLPLRDKIENEPCDWPGGWSYFASDIEGEFEAFRNLLIANQVMDSLYRWTFGRGHLVICGDLFDRGNDVAAVLWLLYKLEDEARGMGGAVHTILGDHDIMNLSGDFRYV